MRWMVIGLLVSVGALLLVAGAVASHIWRHRRVLATEAADLETQKTQNLELDRALDLGNSKELKRSSLERPVN